MNTDIQLLFKRYKSDTDKAIEWIRSHPNEKSISVTSNVKKIYYGYGGKGCGCCSECERNGSDGHCDCTRVVEEIANGRLEACPYKKTEI